MLTANSMHVYTRTHIQTLTQNCTTRSTDGGSVAERIEASNSSRPAHLVNILSNAQILNELLRMR